MNIQMLRSDKIYKKMVLVGKDKRADIYRIELMKPFEYKWNMINVPIKAKQKGGYDVVMASDMMGVLHPESVDEQQAERISRISDDDLWNTCEKTIVQSFERFRKVNCKLEYEKYLFTILLANPENQFVKMCNGYLGDGGIPGYILLSLVPNDYTLTRAQAALAHECNHNVRWQYQKWHLGVSLADMMISEGLAEYFAMKQFGEDLIGPWVSKTDTETLNSQIKPVIRKGLEVTGFDKITGYLYGDETAEIMGFPQVGLPYCAGYACGYHLIKHYLEKTGKTVEEATLIPTEEIMRNSTSFWNM
ncbi:MAG TPA: DUF2268 domain-containing protein [Thermotogota bacterium]|nr:DUF2268 domain-containing protein [Thermotogota bacterium]HPR95233.1 DUF2268 domain-containing protein [Thermotogota bacterium]